MEAHRPYLSPETGQRRPSGSSWSVLLLETMWKSRNHAPTDCEGQGSYSCSSINDYRGIAGREEHKGLCDNPYLHPAPPKVTA